MDKAVEFGGYSTLDQLIRNIRNIRDIRNIRHGYPILLLLQNCI